MTSIRLRIAKVALATGFVVPLLLLRSLHGQKAPDERVVEERLTFQTHARWSPRINLNADVAMNYGIDPSLPDRIATWRQHGYLIQVMTGVAWGQYQDYLNGQYDGKNHWDEAQTDSNGQKIMHGSSKDIPYISPGQDYGRYLTVGVKRALDAGAVAIYLEEPEFWARGGWSSSFQREWQAYYKEPWQAPNSSVDAQYRASQLKYFLYRRALAQVFDFVRDYGKKSGRDLHCYVPTHSLVNYADWRIVSPESSLIDVGVDGYIAQVWTGTARTPNVYEGERKQRTFETAFLEYGAMQNLVRASGRRVWYLNDPIEDNPNHSWSDYRTNWESTLTASLLQPEVWRYEIMPWPERIFNGKHPVRDIPDERTSRLYAPLTPFKQAERPPIGTGLGGFGDAGNVERVGIPKPYETELQAVIRALGEMKQPSDAVHWEHIGTNGIGVLISDTMMFQRADPTPSDANLGSFFGLALPFVKRGMPVEPVQIESATKPKFLDHYRMLMLTYEGQKPPTPAFHDALAKWVRNGGALIVVDNDGDPYNKVREWWNKAPLSFQSPRQHLFQALGLPRDATGLHRVGGGVVIRADLSPAALTYQKSGAETVRKLAEQAARAVKLPWTQSNTLILHRGPYVVASGLDESVPSARPVVLKGRYINLFDAELPVLNSVTLSPNSRYLLFDLDTVKGSTPSVVAAACRVRNERPEGKTLRFESDGIGDTEAVVRIASKDKPIKVMIGGKEIEPDRYQYADGTIRIQFPNSVESLPVEVHF